MEKQEKENLEQSGVTFKGLFMVFKRFWFLFLALIIACGAIYTFIDIYTHRSQKISYSASARIKVAGVSKKDLPGFYQSLNAYLQNEPDLKRDVANQYAQKTAVANFGQSVEDDYLYYNKEYYNENYVDRETGIVYNTKDKNGNVQNPYCNAWAGYAYITVKDIETTEIYFTSSTLTPTQVTATLNQICCSLKNILGYNYISDTDIKYSSESAYMKDKVSIKDPAGAPAIIYYKNAMAPIIGVAIGIIASVIILLLIYKLDDTIKSKEELESLTGVMFITYIEDIGEVKGGSNK